MLFGMLSVRFSLMYERSSLEALYLLLSLCCGNIKVLLSWTGRNWTESRSQSRAYSPHCGCGSSIGFWCRQLCVIYVRPEDPPTKEKEASLEEKDEERETESRCKTSWGLRWSENHSLSADLIVWLRCFCKKFVFLIPRHYILGTGLDG